MVPRYGIKLGMRFKNVAIRARYCLTRIKSRINRNIRARRRYRILLIRQKRIKDGKQKFSFFEAKVVYMRKDLGVAAAA